MSYAVKECEVVQLQEVRCKDGRVWRCEWMVRGLAKVWVHEMIRLGNFVTVRFNSLGGAVPPIVLHVDDVKEMVEMEG